MAARNNNYNTTAHRLFLTQDKKARFAVIEKRRNKNARICLRAYELEFLTVEAELFQNIGDTEINGEIVEIIAGFERYAISDTGRVYRVKHINHIELYLKASTHDFKHFGELKINYRPSDNRAGRVGLTDAAGKLHSIAANYLVAKTFGLINDSSYKHDTHCLIHKDKNLYNNSIENLSIAEFKNVRYKLTPTNIKDIKRYIKIGITLRKIAVVYGVSEMQIGRIKTGENWTKAGRKIKAPEPPFFIENPKIRRLLSYFSFVEVAPDIKKAFYIKRAPGQNTNNIIFGIVNGYKFKHPHQNITRARDFVARINEYFKL